MTIILLIMHISILTTQKARHSKGRSLQSILEKIQLNQAFLPAATPQPAQETTKTRRPKQMSRPTSKTVRAKSGGQIFKSDLNRSLVREESAVKTEVHVEELDEQFYQKYPRLRGKLFIQQEVQKDQPSLTLEQLPFFKEAIERRKRAISKKAAALLKNVPLVRINNNPVFNKLFGGRLWKDRHDCQILKLLRRPLKDNQVNDLPWRL